jgi:dipeptidyl aminopeptidase/acylaminoacyl peptidase
MKKLLFIGLTICSTIATTAQKKVLEIDSYKTWPRVSSPKISPDGQYISYSLSNEKESMIIIKSVSGNWEKQLPTGRECWFADDSRKLIFRAGKDTMGIITVGKGDIKYWENVKRFNVVSLNRKTRLLYLSKDNDFIIEDVKTGKKSKYPNVNAYELSAENNAVVIQKTAGSNKATDLFYVDLNNYSLISIGAFENATDFIFDGSGQALVFSVLLKEGRTIRYFGKGQDSSTVLVSPTTPGMEGYEIVSYPQPKFSSQGDKLFFSLAKKVAPLSPGNNASKLRVWDYKDDSLKTSRENPNVLAMINLNGKADVCKLLEKKGRDFSFSLNEVANGNYVFFKENQTGNTEECHWRDAAVQSLNLVSTNEGHRTILVKRHFGMNEQFSPAGKYLVWFDRENRCWMSYSLKNKVLKNISEKVRTEFYANNRDYPAVDLVMSFGSAGWLENDQALLIYDLNDIWKIDPDGVGAPVNLTNGYGLRHSLQFRFLELSNQVKAKVYSEKEFILTAFDQKTKDQGFFKLDLNGNKLTKLDMQGKTLFPGTYTIFEGAARVAYPLKAKYAQSYMINAMSATDALNFYYTQDFKNFKAVSTVAPHREYNWLTCELVHWTLPNGKPGEGLLYKPENFDPSKKYPMIVHYYEKNAEGLNGFIVPGLSTASINIAFYVSNGYLVFVPDIEYTIGHAGESAANAIISGAQHIAGNSWVNTKKIGIQGHSFGGFETNFVLTKTSMFAAAASMAGISDWIAVNNGNTAEGGRLQWFTERTQGRIGATLKDRPDLYIENSPLYHADKVTTPSLIIHGRQDNMVSFFQGMAWYNALTRNGNKTWLLDYPNSGHVMSNNKDQLDYTIRMRQFFDHYLKDQPAPKWMTGNYNPDHDEIETGYILDNIGKP